MFLLGNVWLVLSKIGLMFLRTKKKEPNLFLFFQSKNQFLNRFHVFVRECLVACITLYLIIHDLVEPIWVKGLSCLNGFQQVAIFYLLLHPLVLALGTDIILIFCLSRRC